MRVAAPAAPLFNPPGHFFLLGAHASTRTLPALPHFGNSVSFCESVIKPQTNTDELQDPGFGTQLGLSGFIWVNLWLAFFPHSGPEFKVQV
jgi:hypothetical protein